MSMKSFNISLFKNACSFIEEAAKKAVESSDAPWHWKFAILNIVQAIELSFKERLRREHPAFIYQNVDAQNHTVGLRVALKRLQQLCGCEFSEDDIRTILSASKKRNAIIHHEFEINPIEAKVIFARLIGFLSRFFNKHLDQFIDTNVDSAAWRNLLKIKEFGDSLYQTALKNIKDNNYQEIVNCPTCNYDTFVIQNGINSCLVCGHLEDVYECEGCGEILFEREVHQLEIGEYDQKLLCYRCYDGEMGMDYYYEQAHGK